MASEARTIELTISSATNLKNLQKFGRDQRCYAVAYIYTAQRQATHTDSSCGVNPIWNAPMTLTCYETDLYPDGSASASSSSSSSSVRVLTIDIYCKSSGVFSKGDKHVGTVVVPLQYIASAVKVDGLAMTFDVHRPSGRVQGKLNMTVKLGEKRAIEDHSSEQMPSYSYYDKVDPSPMMPPIVRYNMASSSQLTRSVNHQPKFGSEVVTGYPAAGYGFAPLGQLPTGNKQRVAVGQPYVPERPMTKKERKEARRAQKAERKGARRAQKAERKKARRAYKATMDPRERKARNRRHRSIGMLIVGGIILGLILM